MLAYLSDEGRYLFHGTSDPSIKSFVPRQPKDANPFGAQNAVYASSDGIWAMFYAILDRNPSFSLLNSALRFLDNGGNTSEPYYYFSIEQSARTRNAFSDGFVYLLPKQTFERDPMEQLCGRRIVVEHWASLEPVEPLALVRIAVSDFPFLQEIRGHDDSVLWKRMEEQGLDCFPWIEEE